MARYFWDHGAILTRYKCSISGTNFVGSWGCHLWRFYCISKYTAFKKVWDFWGFSQTTLLKDGPVLQIIPGGSAYQNSGNIEIIVKIVGSEIDFRVLYSTDWTNLGKRLILKTPSLLGLSSVKIPPQSVQYVALHVAQQEQEDEPNIPPIRILKPLPQGFQKLFCLCSFTDFFHVL